MRRRWASRDSLRTGAATIFLLAPACGGRYDRKNSAALGRCRFGAGLSGLLFQALAGNAHALLLIRIGWTQRAKIRRDLTDLILVRAGHGHVRLLFHRDLNSFRTRKLDRVRIAERQDQVLALHLGAIADADDVEVLLESGGDAGDGVGDQRAGETMQRAVLFGFALGGENSVFLLERNSARHLDGHLALGTLDFDVSVHNLNLHARRNGDNFVSNSRHGSLSASSSQSLDYAYQTSQSSSPPTPSLRADVPVIRPRGVETMAIPMPPTTGLIPNFPT